MNRHLKRCDRNYEQRLSIIEPSNSRSIPSLETGSILLAPRYLRRRTFYCHHPSSQKIVWHMAWKGWPILNTRFVKVERMMLSKAFVRIFKYSIITWGSKKRTCRVRVQIRVQKGIFKALQLRRLVLLTSTGWLAKGFWL